MLLLPVNFGKPVPSSWARPGSASGPTFAQTIRQTVGRHMVVKLQPRTIRTRTLAEAQVEAVFRLISDSPWLRWERRYALEPPFLILPHVFILDELCWY